MINPIVSVWAYFKDMNSEDTKVSIKRNMAWGFGSLAVFVEVFCLVQLPLNTDPQIRMFISVAEFFAVLDVAFVLLALSITSIEKLRELAMSIRPASFFAGGQPAEEKKPDVVIETKTEVTTGTN